MNERPRNLSKFRKLSAYIRQDNQLHGNLTVDEAMSVAAKLKVGDKSSSERETIVSSFSLINLRIDNKCPVYFKSNKKKANSILSL